MIFKPFVKEGLKFKNRLVMPGMTRCRAEKGTGMPTDIMNTYYTQRADSAGLLISEFMPVSRAGDAWPGGAYLWTEAHAKKWKEITDSVHQKNTVFFAQIGHGGRIVNSMFSGEKAPIGVTDDPAPGMMFTPKGNIPYCKPVAATPDTIKQIIDEHVESAKNAKKAGFDGIEIGAATGLLLDQFLKTASNTRKDSFGGSIENRARFLLDTIDAAAKVYPTNRIGVKLSPVTRAFGMYTDDPKSDLAYLLQQFEKRDILYANLVEPENMFGDKDGSRQIPEVAEEARKTYQGFILANGYKPVKDRLALVEHGWVDLVGFARYHAANPDLADRLKNGWELQEFNPQLAYGGGEKGYIDYLTYEEAKKLKKSENE